MILTLKVPVKPYVFKYLNIKYGSSYRLNRRDCIGICLYQMLRRKEVLNTLEIDPEKYSKIYEVDPGARNIFKQGCTNLDNFTVQQFNSMCSDLVMAEFYAFVDNLVMWGIQQKDAIAAFMAKYQFDETDIKYDALKKAYQRYRIQENSHGRTLVIVTDALPVIGMLRLIMKPGQAGAQNISAAAA